MWKMYLVYVCAVFALSITGCVKEQQFDIDGTVSGGGPNESVIGAHVANEVLLKFREGTNGQKKNDILSSVRGKTGRIKEYIYTRTMEAFGHTEGIYLVVTQNDAPSVVPSFSKVPEVEYIEPNFIFTHTAVANDPEVNLTWGMGTGFGSQAVTAWKNDHTGSSKVVIGVVDEGIDVTHPDLSANIWINEREKKGTPGVDDDGNNYIDDINGWDFVNNDNSVYDGPTLDQHGTHVAGTIGATGNNLEGVAGVNWAVQMISCKFLGPNGGTAADAAEALDYLTALQIRHQPALNIVASNNSWGGGPFSWTIHNAIARGARWNILFIAAAGNSGMNNDAAPHYPANYNTTENPHEPCKYDAVISVAALESNGNKARYSNYGSRTVDLAAPGSSVYSTIPEGKYGYLSGTSMATPHVTGGVALFAASKNLWVNNNTLDANGHISTVDNSNAVLIRNAILSAAKNTPTKSMSRKCTTNGRLNLKDF